MCRILASPPSSVVGDKNVEFVVKLGDADGDHNTDLADFALFQACAGRFDTPCVRSDFSPSMYIDAGDIAAFDAGITGP